MTKDTARPFIVEANGMEVKVYGTQFNVNTRRDDQIQTTLVEGSVSVKPKGLAEVMLKPNQQAVFNTFAGRVTVRMWTCCLTWRGSEEIIISRTKV